MLLVLSALVAVGVLAYAMLAAATLQTQTLLYRDASTRAAVLAESGVALARFCLTHPDQALNKAGRDAAQKPYYTGQENVTVGDAGDAFDVTVAATTVAGTFDITATGRCRTDDGQAVERKLFVRLAIPAPQTWQPLAGLHVKGDVTLGSTFNVDEGVATDGVFKAGKKLDKNVYAANFADNAGWKPPPAAPQRVVPDFDALALVDAAKKHGGRYVLDGKTCQAQFLAPLLDGGNELPATLTPKTTNPAAVFIWDQPRPLVVPATAIFGYQATFVVTQSDMIFRSKTEVTPKSAFPGVIVKKSLVLKVNDEVRIHGLSYAEGLRCDLTFSGAKLHTDGALLLASGASLASGFSGELHAHLRLGEIDVAHALSSDATNPPATVLSWQSD